MINKNKEIIKLNYIILLMLFFNYNKVEKKTIKIKSDILDDYG